MASKKAHIVKDTDKAKNIQVEVNGKLTIDEMEQLLINVSRDLNLTVSHITTLSRKKYPGNRHWHFKEDLKSKGCLDITYWPDGCLFWITVRNYEPNWVHEAGAAMAHLIEKRLA